MIIPTNTERPKNINCFLPNSASTLLIFAIAKIQSRKYNPSPSLSIPSAHFILILVLFCCCWFLVVPWIFLMPSGYLLFFFFWIESCLLGSTYSPFLFRSTIHCLLYSGIKLEVIIFYRCSRLSSPVIYFSAITVAAGPAHVGTKSGMLHYCCYHNFLVYLQVQSVRK